MRTLCITNDFPPRIGGIQSFVHNLVVRQPAGSVVVYASTSPGAEAFDAQQPFEVVRDPRAMLLPTPAVAQRAAELARAKGCDTVWFGAAAPLGLLAASLRKRAGIRRVVAQTHGHEAGWAMLPGPRHLLRQIGSNVDAMTYLGEHFRVRLERVLAARCALHKLASGVDTDAYHPGLDGLQVRKRYRLADRPVIVCVSRVVPRKGQDTLIRALPAVQRRVADAALLVVGEGSYRATLERLARETGVDGDVFFTGTVPHEELPVHYAAGDVFAMPCRTRRLGLEAEGLGIVYLEAAACGLPVIAGDSGSSAEAVLEGHTGFVTDGRDLTVLTDRLVTLLQDSELARRMGTAGRAWIEREWRWSVKAQRMAALLAAN